MRSRFFRAIFVCCALLAALTLRPRADGAAQPLPFFQDWTNINQITADDNWSGVPGIIGYRGDGLASATGVNPQTILGEGTAVVDVNANQTAPNTFATGGVAEFHLANPVVALNGSGTARAPSLVISVNTTGQQAIQVAYNLRDIDGSTDNAISPVALQYRIGTSGNFTNLPAGFVADASSGPSLATLVTPVSVTLPGAADNQPVVQVRIITTDAVGNDEWIGIDDISIAGTPIGDAAPAVASTTPAAGAVNVAADSNVVIDFSENINATTSAFSIVCNATAQTFAQGPSANVASVTLDPVSPLPAGASCTVTVFATQVTDTDTTDPPDQMAANYTFSFTTEAAPAVTGTTPANGATGVGINANIVIAFSESVNAAAGAFDVQCPAGAPQTFTQTGSPAASFTLTPASPWPAATSCSVTVHGGQITDTDTNDPPDAMASDYMFSFATANAPPPGAGNVVINEVDADTPGSDTAEFVELYDGGAGNTPLDGLVVVFYNGGDHKSYAAFDLDGFTTNGNGYFTLGNPGVPGVDLIFDPGPFGLLQNGADAVALYVGNAADFPNGTDVTTANLQDAIVYDTDDPDDPVLLALLNADQPQVNENGGGSGATQSNQRCPNGSGGFRNTSSYQQGTPTPGTANSCVPPPPPKNSPVVISQIYGGGGNAGATYQNDYVELYNRGASVADLTGWTLQYTSASGNSWDFTRQPIGGSIGPGQYYLVALASGGANGAPLPTANVVGQINMSATNGKIALVDTFEPLVGNCPTFNPHVMDLVGYGSADCREGSTTAPSPSNTTALFRLGGGSVDTNNNGSDFVKDAPNPRRTAPIVELGPQVLSTDPRVNGVNAPRDATILVTFTEPVDVVDPWFTLSCASSGVHTSATYATNFAGRDHYITPNDNFTAGEQCTVTILKDQIHDVDTDDAGPNTDTLPANYVWSFTVSTGTAPPFPSSVHLTMGNPTGATTSDPNNYLMEKAEYALSYNRDKGRPNWASWHLSAEWVGTLTRVDTFRPDPAVPPDWYRVRSFDFSGSGFDRGHMVPNADRDKETSIPINQATFLMSNMVAQSPDNNQGPWASLEGYLRTLVDGGNELYIVAGPLGIGGSGSNGGVTTTLAGGHVTVPASTWKVALVIPAAAGNDVARVTCAARTIAVIMPNTQGIRNDPWENYLTTVDAVETLTGYDFFSNLPQPVQTCVEAGINGNNEKNAQTITFTPLDPKTYGDADFAIDATASSGLPVALNISGPATLSGNTVHLIGTGTVTITASQAGDDNFKPASDVTRSFEVAKGTPLFSALGAPTIEVGTATVTIGGTLSLGALMPTGSVAVTLNGNTVTAPIGAGGAFSATLPSSALTVAGSPYPVALAYAGDPNFTAAAGASQVSVIDTRAPSIGAVSADPGVLGPPNHKMIDVFVAYTVSDLSGAACTMTVSSNEPINGADDGNTAPDWIVIDAHHVRLRAERAGTGTGRVYAIVVTCTDGVGNASSAGTTVGVPK